MVRGELRAAQGEGRRREGEEPARQLRRGRTKGRAANDANGDRARSHRREHRRTLEGKPRLGQPPPDVGQDRDRLDEPRGPPQERAVEPRRHETFLRGSHLELPGRRPDRRRPGGRAVHENAILERHSAEADLFRSHTTEPSEPRYGDN